MVGFTWPLTTCVGEHTIAELLPALDPQIVVFIGALQHMVGPPKNGKNISFKLLLYLKLDDVPVTGVGSIFQKADLIVTMSEWARKIILSQFPWIAPAKVDCIYSPADTTRFKALAQNEKQDMRAALLPSWMPRNAFLLGWVGRARWRKQIWIMYKVIHYLRCGQYLVCSKCQRVSLFDWDPITQRHRGASQEVLNTRPKCRNPACTRCGFPNARPAEPLRDVFLWLHTPEDDPMSDWPLSWLEEEYGVRRNQDIYYTEGCGMKAALAPTDMPALYQLWDCLMYLSGSEGFGLPAWEAMCSSLPVIYTTYSSHAEYLSVAEAGVGVDGVLQPEEKTGFWRMIADVPATIEAVRRIYFNRELGRALGANGRAFVEPYRTQIIVEKWHQIFQDQLKRSPEI